MTDRTLHHVGQLAPHVQPLALELVRAARVAGLPIVITSSRRTPAEQARLVASGHSRTMRSRHLTGAAFDVDVYRVPRDQVPRWVWDALGPYGESLGLTWGGRWTSLYDPGHFELPGA